MRQLRSLLSLSPDQCEPMSNDLMRAHHSGHLLEKEVSTATFTAEVVEKCGPTGLILWDRLSCNNVTISTGTALVVLTHAGGNPGNVVLWAFALMRIHRSTGQPVTLKLLTTFFPLGFPTSVAMLETWRAQKEGGRNWLDDPTAWEQVEEPR